MTQNTSSAVMQQRREPHDSLDFFPTPPWVTRALCEHLGGRAALAGLTAWEPACGEGHMARPLAEYFAFVRASDVHAYGHGEVLDFLMPIPPDRRPHWIITNPPFRLAEHFIDRAFGIATGGVAMLVRSAFIEGKARYQRLFSVRPPSMVLQFAERVPMVKGRVDADASSATAYQWLVWDLSDASQSARLDWIAPCRKALERDGDYAPPAARAGAGT